MAVSEIIKIRLTAISEYKNEILELLHKLQVIEFISKPEEGALAASDVEYDLAQVKFALKFLQPYDESKVPLQKKILGNKISLTSDQLQKITQEFDHKQITKEVVRLNENLNNAKNSITKCNTEIKDLTPWQKLFTTPANIGQTKFTISEAGVLNLENYEILVEKLTKYSEKTEIIKIDETETEKYLILVWQKDVDEKIRKILSQINWETANFTHEDKKPAQAINDLKKEIEKQEKNIVEIENKIKDYTKHISNLKVLEDYLTWETEKQEASGNFSNTQQAFTVLGWIEKRNFKTLEEKISDITEKFTLEEEQINENESVPVTIKNNDLFSPFEMVTGIYGMPLSKEPDPTPYLAGFFTIFFGMALTDAGYGFVLALFAFLAIKILKIPKEKSKLFRVLIWGGVSTFILGALFGGWFGIVIDEQLPESVANVLNSVRVIDPVANPITVLIITMVMGIVQLMTGVTISMYWKIKQGKLMDGLLDDGIWLFILLSLSLWLMAENGVVSSSVTTIGKYMIYTGLIAAVFAGGRKQKIYLIIPMGMLGLYNNISGYFSVVLSYSRLLALGLATGIIAMVINMIAMLAKDMIPYVGWIIAILIIIGGHIFNLVINVLGAFIHSARLQFVEFFGQFMEGGGSRFKPFSRENKNIEITK